MAPTVPPEERELRPFIPTFIDAFLRGPVVPVERRRSSAVTSASRKKSGSSKSKNTQSTSTPAPAPVAAAADPNPTTPTPTPSAENASVAESVPATTTTNDSVPASTTSQPATAVPVNETASIASEIVTWTAIEDAGLVGMMTQGKTWGEVAEVMPTKTIDQLKQRCTDLGIDVKGKGKDEKEEASEGEGGDKAANKGKPKNKGKGKKNVKFATLPAADSSDESGIDPGEDSDASTNDSPKLKKKPGVLKVIEVDSDTEELTSLEGHPVVFVRPEDELTEEQLQMLFQLTRKNDGFKWLEVASRFYDKTGIRMDPELLKAMLKNL